MLRLAIHFVATAINKLVVGGLWSCICLGTYIYTIATGNSYSTIYIDMFILKAFSYKLMKMSPFKYGFIALINYLLSLENKVGNKINT